MRHIRHDRQRPSNDYIIPYPTSVILPDIARVPVPGSIRAHSSNEQAWNSYAAPYRGIEAIESPGLRKFRNKTDHISKAFMFVERLGDQGISRHDLLGLPSAVVEGTPDTILGSHDPTGLSSFVMGWVKQLRNREVQRDPQA